MNSDIIHDQNYFYRNEVYIEVTNHCNIRCNFCANPSLKFHKGMMSYDDFKQAVDKISEHHRVTSLNFVGMGETFLNPDIWSMINYAYTKKLDLYCCTNGKWHASDDKLQSIVKLKNIHITLDAITNDVLKYSRPNTDVAKIISSIKDIFRIRKHLGASTPHVQVRMNLFSFNRHQLFDLVNMCQDIGVDSVWIARGSAPEKFQTLLSDKEWEQLPHDYVYTSGFLQSDQFDIDERTGRNSWRQEIGTKSILNEIGCNGFTIRWDGTATPCCFDFNCSVSMGNIKNQSLMDMWSRQKVEAFEKKLLSQHQTRKQSGQIIACDTCNHFLRFKSHFVSVSQMLTPQKATAYPADIEEMVNKGFLDTAETKCNNLLSILGPDPRVLHLLGIISYRRGNRSKSQALIRKAIIESSLLNSRFHEHLAAIYEDINDIKKYNQYSSTANQMLEYAQNFNLGDSL